jgi:hypothetical protein
MDLILTDIITGVGLSRGPLRAVSSSHSRKTPMGATVLHPAAVEF